ncbi:DNA N-6-adenine-methyltransferase [Chromohalobacter sp. 296-RDG]|uniref:DNA N-6-adenine-methyltransferase n=1 Tax=Chromohalobacter sp. 296-RDG TaxID=2994062 RepID=UPI002469A733|nr:DNA N-6-adenine-methyltransferase [Chromohalobacter sp. 296-RDG]
MSAWEPNTGATDDWYTPAYIFEALGVTFDLDVAAPPSGGPHVPAYRWIHEDSLSQPWEGFVWMNPPFGGRNGLAPWLDKFFLHGNGIALTPDRTSAPWWQEAAGRADALLLMRGKVKFLRSDGSLGRSPGNGTTLFASGPQAVAALERASGLGFVTRRAAA